MRSHPFTFLLRALPLAALALVACGGGRPPVVATAPMDPPPPAEAEGTALTPEPVDLGPDFPHYAPDEPFEGDEDGLKLFFCWFPIDALHTMRVYPTFVRDALYNLPDHVEHVVHHESK